jgi:hypothetical protein
LSSKVIRIVRSATRRRPTQRKPARLHKATEY